MGWGGEEKKKKVLLMNLLVCVLVFDAQPVIYSFLTYAFVIEPAVRKEDRNDRRGKNSHTCTQKKHALLCME